MILLCEEQSPDSSSEDGDDTSVSTRPWTRSQGPPPALIGTQSLSKCCLNAPPCLLQEQVGARMARPTSYTGRLVEMGFFHVGGATPLVMLYLTAFVSVY